LNQLYNCQNLRTEKVTRLASSQVRLAPCKLNLNPNPPTPWDAETSSPKSLSIVLQCDHVEAQEAPGLEQGAA
jgi:hypothetical protein